MDDSKTKIKSFVKGLSQSRTPFGLDVTLSSGNSRSKTLRYFTSFVIGRDSSCDIQQDSELVSRRHAELFFDKNTWHIRDLGSTNGVYVNDKRVAQSPLATQCKIQLGLQGPCFWVEPACDEVESDSAESESVTMFVQRYLAGNNKSKNSERAKVVRQAFKRVNKKQVRKYRGVMAGIAIMLAVAISVGVYQQYKLRKLYTLATEIFYSMKELEVQLVQQEQLVGKSGESADRILVVEKRKQVMKLEAEYEKYLEQSGLLPASLTEEERLIFRVARILGECELTMPDSFVEEVKSYIKKWQSTPTLEMSISRAKVYNFVPIALRALKQQDLPLQFFYIGLQESRFKIDAVGPKTRYGYAKGPWQFIPSTAVRYGLKLGPLKDQKKFDPLDERHNITKSTYASARYLKDIYATEAQASGLLVMASYNWGEHNVRRLINKMPENPRERNFWQLIKRYKIPDETYKYVLYIFAAAVIGENPALFDFGFDNPLES